MMIEKQRLLEDAAYQALVKSAYNYLKCNHHQLLVKSKQLQIQILQSQTNSVSKHLENFSKETKNHHFKINFKKQKKTNRFLHFLTWIPEKLTKFQSFKIQ